MEETKVKKKKPEVKQDTWVYKDRNYYLLGSKTPLTYTIMSRHSRRYPCVWFDPAKGHERELRYATNQQSIFVDEQKGPATLKHIVFESGHLMVPKEKRNLQEFLAHHPHRGIIFEEFDAVQAASDQYEDLNLELDAMLAAKQMEIDQAEAILRVEMGTQVGDLSSKEIKRDILLMAKKNPKLFIALANDDNVTLRNFAIKAVENNIIRVSSDQRTVHWGSNNRKLMTVPFDENPFSAIAAWFKTDEGMEVYKTVEKKLK
tara:strand:+ start:115 stop:894 length:780 start_codon:yes stop_codon:yes gene_type:complete